MASDLPPSTAKPCDECPWRRTSVPGFVGPHDPNTWLEMAHSDIPIACHKTIARVGPGEDDTTYSHQCAGAAIYRSNVHKLPRDPAVVTLPADRQTVFGHNLAFRKHHNLRSRMMRLRKWMLEEWSGCSSSWTKARMVDHILSYGAPTHHAVLQDYERMLNEQA